MCARNRDTPDRQAAQRKALSARRLKRAEALCLCAAVVLVAPLLVTDFARNALVDEARAGELLVRSEDVAQSESASRGEPAPIRAGAPDQSLWSAARRAAYVSLVGKQANPIGVLRISRLDAVIPVFDGATEPGLTLGAGHLRDTAPLDGEGTIALSSHRDGAFRVLKHVRPGDEFILETASARRRFVAYEQLIVEPERVDVLAPGDETRLTLVTCYPFYYVGRAPQRFVLHARLVESTATAVPTPAPAMADAAPLVN